MSFKMKITETVKTATGERHIEVEGEVNSLADRTELIQAVSAAARDARGFAEKALQEETTNSGFGLELPMMICDQSKVSPESLKALKTAPVSKIEYVEQTPSNSVSLADVRSVTSVEEVEEMLRQNPVVPMVEGQFKAFVSESKTGVKAAPIVSPFALFDEKAPVVLPLMTDPNPVWPIDYSQKTVPFDPPAVTQVLESKNDESWKNKAWQEANARSKDGLSVQRLLAQASKDAAQKGKALGR